MVEAGRVGHPEGDGLTRHDRDRGQLGALGIGDLERARQVELDDARALDRAGRVDRPAACAAATRVRPADERPIRVAPAGGHGRGVGRRLEVRVAPAADLDGLRGRTDLALGDVGDVGPGRLGRRAQERDELLDLAVVERPDRLSPDRHHALGIAAHEAAALGEDGLDVQRVEVSGARIAGRRVGVVERHLVVERRPDTALAVHTVTRRAVGLVERIAARDVGDVLLLADPLEIPADAQGGHADGVEPVERDEEDEQEDGQERDTAGIAALADDLRGALLGQLDPMGALAGVEALDAHRGGLAGRDLAAGLASRQLPPGPVLAHMHPVGLVGGMRPGCPSATGRGPRVILAVSMVSTPSELTTVAKRSRLRGAGPSLSTLVPRRS